MQLQINRQDSIISMFFISYYEPVSLLARLDYGARDMRGNHSFNRGPKSVNGRVRSLMNLRNVGHKMAVDKEYKEQVYEDGMNYVSQRRAREAAATSNEFRRQVKKNIINKKTKDIDALKAYEAMHSANKNLDDLSIEEACEIDKHIKARKSGPVTAYNFSKPNKQTNYRRYGFMQGVWTPTGKGSSSFYDEYAVAQKSGKKYY